MCDVGRIVGGAPPRSWRSSVRQYHRWQDVLPDVDLHCWDEEAAIKELIHRYLRSYGSVTIDDIAW
ncbi:MAG: winged helix DNA-binding domain-containing protein [bacterium]|nr:winged helix DNA-binding domain-containing protein [bacterium]